MPEESDPPRKFYGLKESEFDEVNKRSDHHASIDAKDLFRHAAGTGNAMPARPTSGASGPDRNTLSRPASSLSGIPNQPRAPGENDVHGILQDNLARANAAGLNELAEKPARPSRRKRDYWFLMVAGNALLAVLFASATASGNAFLMAFAAGGIGLISAGLTWVMWFVMDDY